MAALRTRAPAPSELDLPVNVLCECRARRCHRRLYVTEGEYRTLSRLGLLLSAECAMRENRRVVANFNGYRIVAAANRGKALV